MKKIVIFISLILMIFIVGCSTKDVDNPISRTEIIMGTTVGVTLYENGSEEVLDKVFKRVQEIENLVSINKEETEIDKLNENAGISPVKLSDSSFEIIEKALYYSKLSTGGYDLTVGPLVKLWNIGLEGAKVPTPEEISNTLPLIDYNSLELNKEGQTIFLTKKNMMIDLGSIAKGYAADEISKILAENNVHSAIINLGGNVYAHGEKIDGSDWKIGIQNPFNERGNIVGLVKVKNKTVVTSGIYERYIEQDGVKYHHLLDPKTGYPFDNNIAGVSIITDKSIDADALSTIVFSKGVDEGLKFVEDLPNVDAIFITKDNKIYLSKGIKNIFELQNEDFTLAN